MTNEEPKYVKSYVVLDDGETYCSLEGCTIVRVAEAGEELLENMDGIKSLLRDYEPDGLYKRTPIPDCVFEVLGFTCEDADSFFMGEPIKIGGNDEEAA